MSFDASQRGECPNDKGGNGGDPAEHGGHLQTGLQQRRYSKPFDLIGFIYSAPLPNKDSDTYDVIIGSARMMQRHAVMVDGKTADTLEQEQQKGHISVLCAVNGEVVAVISIADKVKKEAALAVYSLQQMGMRVVLLTGDNAKTAESTAKQVGIAEVFAEVLPNQKQEKIKQLQVGVSMLNQS